VKLLNINIQVW